ncbi:lipopolysaccharide/colanic/teichoic acid biosynthesis glycosyltransferase [Litorimonas taeanensis]|uniref:Lipopolysaccharide/colanic/teichoic acid biosynthesis glycosyltransferase n=1 Tax=Litorimonas taeanensis TaxID=568099 RepID=A0A420WDN1_9PROT|nr:sugar transferase [Litorimonas taeanensis]RKQ69096.1 lipopolysaccharide/colanic/teichoic acid biosynthesis glycosyltransferase [Litorimonas taeanensis]
MLKRAFDITSSGLALIILAPILLLTMLVLRLTGEGEIFFLQERMGYKNKPFNITKFATMVKSAAFMKAGDYTTKGDPRILPVGKFLRKTKINEIIQLWDVFRGKMSLVGPRPQMLRVHNLYPDEYNVVFEKVRPGITGVGSIVFRDEEMVLTQAVDRDVCYTKQIVPYKAQLEMWYAENASFILDIKIIFMTLWYIVKPESRLMNKILPDHLQIDVSTFTGEI